MLGISGAGVDLNNRSGYRVQAPYIRGSSATDTAQKSFSAAPSQKPALPGAAAAQDGFSPALPFAQAADVENPAGIYKRLFPTLSGSDAAETGEFSPQGAQDAKAPITRGKTAAEVAEDGECKTCENRKYQDGSDDPGVSFKAAGKIDKSVAASTIRAHEHEHVKRNAAKAQREGKEVVMSRVVLHTGICPECGDTYYSGGTTTTVTRRAYDKAMELDPQGGANMSRTTVDAEI